MEDSTFLLKKASNFQAKASDIPLTLDLPANVNIQKSILIRNFSSHVSEKQLSTLFGLFGEVILLRILRRFGKTSCRALVTFREESNVQAALNMLGNSINWNSLKAATLWSERNFAIDGNEQDIERDSNHILSVENLPPRTHHDRLEALFSIFGTIDKINMSNENKTFNALIYYNTPYSPEAAAVCMDGFLEGKKVVTVCVIVGHVNEIPVKMKVSDDVGVGISPWELRQLYVKLKTELKQPLGYSQPSLDEPCCSKSLSLSDVGRSTSPSENDESEIIRHTADLKISSPVVDIPWTKLMASKNLTISFIVDLTYSEDHHCYATYDGDVTQEILPCSSNFRVPQAENTIVVRSGLIYLQVIIRLFPEHQKEYFDSANPIKYAVEKASEDLYLPLLLHLSVSCSYSDALFNLTTFSRASVDVTNFGEELLTLDGKCGKRSFLPVPYEAQTTLVSVPLEAQFMGSVKESFNKWTASESYDPSIPGIGHIKMHIPYKVGYHSFLFPTHAILEDFKMEPFNEYRTSGF